MAWQVFTSSSIGTGVRINLGTADDVFIAPGATISRTDDTGDLDFTILGTGSNHRVDVAGTVLSTQIAIEVGDDQADTGNVVNITASGILRGFEWSSSGVRMNGSANVLKNAGDIWGAGSGVVMCSYGETTSTITNSGTIGSDSTGIARYNSAAVNGTISLENRGTVFGRTASYNSGLEAKDLISNTGRMIGDIYLGGGDDGYDGVSGRLSGKVLGGLGRDDIRGGIDNDMFNGDEGNDKLYGGSGNDTLNGGADRDLLDGGAGQDLLDGGTGVDTMSGGEGHDRYVVDDRSDRVIEKANQGTDLVQASVSHSLSANVENLTLTGTENIAGIGNELANAMRGNTGANSLKGGSGNDMLKGEAGDDALFGGAGADKLYGGTGADTFVFTATADSTASATGRDTIYDFDRTQKDKIDLKAIDASTKVSGDQAFTFIGTEAFHNKAGELRYEKKGGDTFVHGDINGDGKADFSIMLDLSLTMSKTDFIL